MPGVGKPIVIADYDPAWPERFERERALIFEACGREAFVRIEHVGSTAVSGLAAKPIIDMMPGLRSLEDAVELIAKLEGIGYEYVPEYERPNPIDEGLPDRRYFRKDAGGERAFHLHMVEAGGEFWRTHLMFRNYLRFNRRHADEYARIKREIAARYNERLARTGEHVDTNLGYTNYKTEFVEGVLNRARERIARSTPVVVCDYDPSWPEQFARERARIADAIADLAVAIEHVGSTSVPGLAAKPTVDIAVGVHSMYDARRMVEPMAAVGYAHGVENFPDWFYFDRGESGHDRFHVHAVPHGGERWQRYLAFRDELRSDAAARGAYTRLKRALAEEFGQDRIGYVEAKTDFIIETGRRRLDR